MKKQIYYCINCKINEICYTNFLYGKKTCRECYGKLQAIRQTNKDNSNFRNGNYCKNKVHYCIEKKCNNKVSESNRRCKSCSKKGSLNWSFGKKRPDSRKRMIENNPMDDLKVRKRVGKKTSIRMKKDWQNKKYIEKMIKLQIKGRTIKPNKPEKQLKKLLNTLLPKEYKFVGNFKFWVERFNPDFINCNGQKKIIELYGDYWHNLPSYKKRDRRRLKSYSKYGYKTLIIW